MQLSRFWINTGLFSDREIPGDDKIHGERWENLSEGTDRHRWDSQESVRLGIKNIFYMDVGCPSQDDRMDFVGCK